MAELQRQAVRSGISDLYVNLARRNQPLLTRQLSLIEDLEHGERDPDRLATLFTLDHLATRMRRNSDSLLVLAGQDDLLTSPAAVPLLDVVRGAVSETADFGRIDTAGIPPDIEVVGYAAPDLAHAVSELLENATEFSPPASRVVVVARRAATGIELTISDEGIGIPSARLDTLNHTLAQPPLPGLALARSLGLIVVARLAHRIGVDVTLRSAPDVGTAAVLFLPESILRASAPSAPETADDDTTTDRLGRAADHRRDRVRAEPTSIRPAPRSGSSRVRSRRSRPRHRRPRSTSTSPRPRPPSRRHPPMPRRGPPRPGRAPAFVRPTRSHRLRAIRSHPRWTRRTSTCSPGAAVTTGAAARAAHRATRARRPSSGPTRHPRRRNPPAHRRWSCRPWHHRSCRARAVASAPEAVVDPPVRAPADSSGDGPCPTDSRRAATARRSGRARDPGRAPASHPAPDGDARVPARRRAAAPAPGRGVRARRPLRSGAAPGRHPTDRRTGGGGMTVPDSDQDLGFLLSNLVEHVPGIREAAVVSSDGLLIALSRDVDRASGDRLAAVAAGLMSVARGAGVPMRAGAVHEVIVELEHALIVVMGISDGSALAVVATRPCDIGLVAYEMAMLADRAGAALTPQLVSDLRQGLPA